MRNKIFFFVFAVFSYANAKGQGSSEIPAPTIKKVKLEVITQPDTNSKTEFKSKTYLIKWPFNEGPLPIGGRTEVLSEIDGILKANKIDCPPVRSLLAPNIWLCGNGKKIRTDDPKLKELLTAAWKENE